MLDQSFSDVLANLRSTFHDGVTRDYQWRMGQLRALAGMLDEHEPAFADALRLDLGKPSGEAYLTETGFLYREVRYVQKRLKSWMQPRRVRVPLPYQPARASWCREPYGVVLIIGAWNYPLQLTVAPLISALAAGNCVVLKPSEQAPAVAALLTKLLPFYLDHRAIAVVEGGIEESRALLALRFDHIFYTGSEQVGREVMQAAARHLTPLTLELGGKCPCIVHHDTDLIVAARRIVWAKFLNAGQTCVAPDYLLVHEEVEHSLLQLMQEELVHYGVGRDGGGSASEQNVNMIVNQRHCARLEALVAGSVPAGSVPIDATGCRVGPAILTGMAADVPLMNGEIFGPLLPVFSYSELDDAIAVIASHGDPLAIYLFSRDKTVQRRIAATTRSGALSVNELVLHAAVHGLPFGGVGRSGFGRYHGESGFDAFSCQRSYFHRPLFPDNSLRYPPRSGLLFPLIRWFFSRFG